MKRLSAALMLGFFLTVTGECPANTLPIIDADHAEQAAPSFGTDASSVASTSVDRNTFGNFRIQDRPDTVRADSSAKLYAADTLENVATPSTRLTLNDPSKAYIGGKAPGDAFNSTTGKPASVLPSPSEGANRSPGSTGGQAIVIELPLPPALPLLAMGLAALLIFAHRPRRR